MPQKSPIEWTDLTSNPIYAWLPGANKRGWACTKVSPGCAHCYSETINQRFGTKLAYSKADTEKVEFRINEEELKKLTQLKKPCRVFVGDMTDVFHEKVTDGMLNSLFRAFGDARHVTFQVLTKRPERMLEYTSKRWDSNHKDPIWRPLPNVWLGVSVEDQQRADERIPILLQTPAAVRFLSVEPLLGPVDIEEYLGPPGALSKCGHCGYHDTSRRPVETCRCDGGCGEVVVMKEPDPSIDWVIIGGESGPGARPMDLAWARSLVKQCQAAGVAVFCKQLGSRPLDGKYTLRCHDYPTEPMMMAFRDKKGGNPEEWPEDLRVRQFPDAGGTRKCRVCGCTDSDCRQCIAKTGQPCQWAEEDLCSACL